MAGWWMPVGQLSIMRRIERGETLKKLASGKYKFDHSDELVTTSAKALVRKNLLSDGRLWPDGTEMQITPTGRNELKYNIGVHKHV